MPELCALGVEWKGESTHENAIGLDMMSSVQVDAVLTSVFFVTAPLSSGSALDV